MAERKPPEWGNDSLSQFFKYADYNARVTRVRYPAVFELLRRVHSAFERTEETVEKDPGWVTLVPAFLLFRTHSTFLAAIRAGMSGQVSEAFPLLRSAIEQSWYALHIAKDPNPDCRVETWLRRNDDAQATAKCQNEFTIKNVRSTHEAFDHSTASELHHIYKTLIDYGAHPNQMGVLIPVTANEPARKINYKVGILYPDELPVMVTLRLSVSVAIGALKVFQLIYLERFALAGFDSDIKQLVDELNAKFKPFGLRARSTNP
jgi:hypothetical protein